VLLAYDRVLLVPRFTRSLLVIADNPNDISTLSFDLPALCSHDDLLVNGTGANNTRAPKSRSLLSFRPKRYPTSRTFCRHHLGSPRRPTLASLLRRPASPGAPPINPGGGFGTMRQQAIQPASTSASAVWSALLQPTRPLSTSPGTMLRVTLDELHALSPDAVYTPPGASRPSRPQRYAQDTSRAAEVIDPGPPSVLRAPVLAPVRPSSTRPRWMPRALGALRPCKRKICRKRVHALPSSDCWHILPWLEPEHFPALHPRRRHLPPPLPGHPAPLFIPAPAPSAQCLC